MNKLYKCKKQNKTIEKLLLLSRYIIIIIFTILSKVKLIFILFYLLTIFLLDILYIIIILNIISDRKFWIVSELIRSFFYLPCTFLIIEGNLIKRKNNKKIYTIPISVYIDNGLFVYLYITNNSGKLS